ncbi:MAG: Lrp/AsnC family transcriptional regulator [Woeseiaceae bacterium]|nr:Lrp/AsnC family transcriptional regulator [Woeseiaceae bacterium]
MSNNLDSYDVSIITALAEDSALTFKELALQVHLSRTSVARRVDVLRDQGFLGAPQSDVNFEKLGFSVRAIIHIVAPTVGSFELRDRILGRPEVLSVSVAAGKAIMIAEAIFRNTNHLHRFLSCLRGVSDSETHVVMKKHVSTMKVRDRIALVDKFLATADDRFD